MKRILIIDDEAQDRKAMTAALRREGYDDIVCAATAEEGIARAKSCQPTIVVIDVVLKGTDGFDVCKRIKAIEGLNVAVLMVTGHLDAVNAEKARHSGADELIEKIPAFTNVGSTISGLLTS
jgi:DNA-binding response OmpR family regulator